MSRRASGSEPAGLDSLVIDNNAGPSADTGGPLTEAGLFSQLSTHSGSVRRFPIGVKLARDDLQRSSGRHYIDGHLGLFWSDALAPCKPLAGFACSRWLTIPLLKGGASWTVSALLYPPLLACWPLCSSLATVRLIGGDGDAITAGPHVYRGPAGSRWRALRQWNRGLSR